MTNALTEFLNHIGTRKVLCAEITHEDWDEIRATARLVQGHTEEEFEGFLNDLGRINYSAGYGSQELFGTIWYADWKGNPNGSWSERWEYDGSEGWDHKWMPEIPTYLNEDLQQEQRECEEYAKSQEENNEESC